MIKITHNGRPFDANRFADELQAHAMELAMAAIESKARGAAGSIVDPETGKHAVVFVDRLPGHGVGIRTSGSIAFARLLEKRLGVDPGDVSVIGVDKMAAEPRVYLAHASEDKAMVRPIAEYFMANGIETWFDEWEIDHGDSLRQKMEEGLGDMTHFMVILTPTSITKPWVAREIDVGLVGLVGGKNRMVPLRVGVDVGQLSPFLQTLLCEAIDPTSDGQLAALVDRLHGISRKPALGAKPKHVITVPEGLEGWSPAAVAIAQHLARASEHAVSFDPHTQPYDIAEATGLSAGEVRLGILDLRDAGMLWQSDHGDLSVAPLGPLFVEFDASVMRFDPAGDAVTLANRLVSDDVEDANTEELAAKLQWEPRRMNSAIAYLERAGAIETVGALASDPWRAVFLSIGDETLRFVRSKS